MQTWACAVALFSLAASLQGRKFYYSQGAYRRADDCNLCFENDCLVFDQARCLYYTEATRILGYDTDDLEGPENTNIKRDVDEQIFDVIEKASVLPHMDCIPFVSRYTDCTKENICVGCQVCSCSANGLWICEISQSCEIQELPLNIDHRVLVLVLENLINEDKPKKKKRSVNESIDSNKTNRSVIPFEDISEWLYGVKPYYATTTTKITDVNMEQNYNTTDGTTHASGTLTNTDTDYVAFDEVLRSIAVDTKGYNRRKLPMDNELGNKTLDMDYMLMDDDNVTSNITDQFAPIANFVNEDGVTEASIDEATKIIIDLLETAGQADIKMNETQDFEFLNNKSNDMSNDFENTNDIIEYNAAHIMKRDVSNISNVTVQPTVALSDNETYVTNNTEVIRLKESVLIPLTDVIKDMRKKIKSLQTIKKSLQNYMQIEIDKPEDNNVSMYNGPFSIYEAAVEAGEDIDLRRANPNGIDKIMFKLKTDVLEIIKDIMAIRQQKDSKVPEDLKVLMHAMKRYVKYNFNGTKSGLLKDKKPEYSRRMLNPNITASFSRCAFLTFRDCVVQIIDTIDKDMPKFNALSPLSPASRNILKNVIKNYYVDDLTAAGLRVNDPQYNLTNDLYDIGKKWQEMTSNLMSGTKFACIYRMKLLHLTLTADISKLNAAAAMIAFSHSRRMLHTLDPVNDGVLERITTGLQAIHNKIQIIVRYYGQKSEVTKTVWTRNERIEEHFTTENPKEDVKVSRKSKKRSFIKHIRSLLKSSKNDIAALLHRKVPKSEIVRHLARKKLDEIAAKKYNEYEETMKRWQRNLDIIPRVKRSLLDEFKARMKGIIPSYLRHKVTPKIKAKRNNATNNSARRPQDHRKKNKPHDRKNRKSAPQGKKTSKGTSPKPETTKTTTKTTHAPSTTVTAAPLNQTAKI